MLRGETGFCVNGEGKEGASHEVMVLLRKAGQRLLD